MLLKQIRFFNYIQDPTSNYVYEPTFVSVFDDVTVSKTEAYAPKDMKTFYPYENTSGVFTTDYYSIFYR